MNSSIFAPTFRHRLALKIIQVFPQIQMVALCNSRAISIYHQSNISGNPPPPLIRGETTSDIDLFIITRRGNLWTGRFIATLVTSVFGVRRTSTHGLTKGSPEYIRLTKDKYCLSFFVTRDGMDLSSVRLQPEDPYLDLWIRTLIPIIDKNEVLKRFLGENSGYGKTPMTKVQIPTKSQNGTCKFLKFRIWDFIGHWSLGFGVLSIIFYPLSCIIEYIIKLLWLPRTLRTYEKLGKPWGVVITDTMLKFHDNDIRKDYRESTR